MFSSMDTNSSNGSSPEEMGAHIDSPYTLLDWNTQQFRLLLLEPGRHNDEIRIQLTPAWLVCPPWYEALSYVWGTELAACSLVANGRFRMAITENLDCALRHLRQPKGIRLLWVDALCINQQNIEERNEQVRQMARIYFASYRTIIWLGSDEGHNYHNLLLHMDHQIEPKPGASYTLGHLLEELSHLTGRPWFSRLWVLQELIMSKMDPVVYIGRFRIPWSDFECGARFVYMLYMKHPFMRLGVEDMDLTRKYITEHAKIVTFNRLRISGPKSSLEARLNDSMLQTATDPRDHVYGILGISDVGQDLLAPDYGSSVQTVYTKTAAVLLEYYSPAFYCTFPLRHRSNGGPTHTVQNPGLPSWVPDFYAGATWEIYKTKDDKQWSPTMLLRTPNMAPILRPFVGNVDRSKHPCIAKFSKDYKTMFAVGKALGTITWASVPEDYSNPGGERRLYDLYHASAKRRGFTPPIFLQALYDFKHVHPNPSDLEYFEEFLECDGVPENIDPKNKETMTKILRSANYRSLFVTDTGKFGQSYHPEKDGIRVGEVLVGLFGNDFPFLLRPMGVEQYEILNVAYVVDHEWGELHTVLRNPENRSWSDIEDHGLRVYEIL